MTVTVHYPAKQEDITALRERVASAHAQAVIHYLHRLSCPDEQKLELVKLIEKSLTG